MQGFASLLKGPGLHDPVHLLALELTSAQKLVCQPAMPMLARFTGVDWSLCMPTISDEPLRHRLPMSCCPRACHHDQGSLHQELTGGMNMRLAT